MLLKVAPRYPVATIALWPRFRTLPPHQTWSSSGGCWRSACPGEATVTALAWSSRFRVHHRVADHYRDRRLLLAGDAAHVHSPTGGQGMNTGIQDGYTLGTAFAAGQLASYEASRRPVAQRVVALTDRMTRIATTHNRVARAGRNLALPLLGHVPAFRTKLATEIADLNYR